VEKSGALKFLVTFLKITFVEKNAIWIIPPVLEGA
jgi:hypothetical protein